MNLLIVDDDPINLRLLRAQLEAEGHTVFDACDGVAALAVLQQQPLDAVISDILMPTMDGYRLCHEVRKQERFKQLPFIIYTATYTSAGDEKLALDLGADKYLRKPAAAEEIVTALHEVSNAPSCRERAPGVTLPDADLMKQYSEQLVNKLEQRNRELSAAITNLQASEARYRALFEYAPDGIVIADSESNYIDANASMCRMLGYTRDELIGLHASDIVSRRKSSTSSRL